MKYRNEVTQQRLKELVTYNPQSGQLFWRLNRRGQKPAGTEAGTLAQDGYIKIRIDGLSYQAHRLIWLYAYGEWPKEEIDHIDLVKSNNALLNLREASHTQNMQNVASRKKEGKKGAHFDKRRNHWYSSIRIQGKQKRIGTFPTERLAHKAYMAASKKYHGDFSRVS
jgi:hypothetical protein